MKLVVDNFLILKNISIESAKINIFIGPQASGKSVLIKLLYFCEKFFSAAISSYQDKLDYAGHIERMSDEFKKIFPVETWGEGKFYIRYESGERYLEIRKNIGNPLKAKVALTSNPELKEAMDSAISKLNARKDKSPTQEFAKYRFHEDSRSDAFSKDIIAFRKIDQIYVPAGRSFFANLQSSFFSFLASVKTLDPFLQDFGIRYQSTKDMFYGMRYFVNDKEGAIDNAATQILKGSYESRKGEDFISSKDRAVKLANCSSGQQEVLPLIMMIIMPSWFYHRLNLPARLFIEEPEAHLFPDSQKQIIDLIAARSNNKDLPSEFFITTHSPYVLAALNNLMTVGYAIAKLKKSHKFKSNKDAIHKICDEVFVLQPKDVNAFYISNGEVRPIKDTDTGLINAEEIDAVSELLAEDASKIWEILTNA